MKNSAPHIVAACMILITFALVQFFILPSRALIADLTTQIDVANQQIGEAQAVVDDLKKVESTVPKTVQEREELLKKVPSSVEQSSLIKTLNKVSSARGIALKQVSFSTGKSTSTPGIGTVQMVTGFEGTYNDLIKLLSDLERNERIINVKSIALELKDMVRDGKAKTAFKLTLESFYQTNNER